MKSYYMRQCILRSPEGGTTSTAWIPESKAVLNKNLIIHEKEWVVAHVSDNRLPYSTVVERSRDYLYTREASDI